MKIYCCRLRVFVAFFLVGLVSIPATSHALSVWGTLNLHRESRSGQEEWNSSAYAGVDFRLLELPLGDFYLGPQVGFFRERVLTFSNDSRTKVSGGARALFRIDAPALPLAFWPVITAEFLNGDDDDPVYFLPFLGAGMSYSLGLVSIDLLAQYGLGPSFDNRPQILRVGLGASLSL